MGKILEASQLTIGFRRHGNSKSRPKRRIRRIPNKLTRKNQLEKPTGSKVYGKRGGIEVSEMLLRQTDRGTINAVDQVFLTIEKGEILGIIGESGSGKSTLAFGLLNLIDVPGEVLAGQVYYWQSGEAIDLFSLGSQEGNRYRWREIATVFQAAQSAMNPILTVEEHFYETAAAHQKTGGTKLDAKIDDLLQYVRLDEGVRKMYPFELSGGMKQRVLIALSLLLDPQVIILDEPTTALDVITQWYILAILRKINQEKGITIVFLTHDLSIVSSMVDRIAVMYAGQLVEVGEVSAVMTDPAHPYTKALLEAIPSLTDAIDTRSSIQGVAFDLAKADATCRFKERCSLAARIACDGSEETCHMLFPVSKQQAARCIHFKQLQEEDHESIT
jgi:peptide/nickel transport system ATP-binding protein